MSQTQLNRYTVLSKVIDGLTHRMASMFKLGDTDLKAPARIFLTHRRIVIISNTDIP